MNGKEEVALIIKGWIKKTQAPDYERRRFTQGELAIEMGIEPGTLSQFLTEGTLPLKRLSQINDILKPDPLEYIRVIDIMQESEFKEQLAKLHNPDCLKLCTGLDKPSINMIELYKGLDSEKQKEARDFVEKLHFRAKGKIA
jgi:transcriptional regulator with XRE-family HTH domain